MYSSLLDFFFFLNGIIAVSSLDKHQLHTPRWLISTIPIPIPTPVPYKSPPPTSETQPHPALYVIPTSDEEKIERRAPSDTRNLYDEWSQRLLC